MTITRENVTTVPVTQGTRARLAALKGYGDCYEHVIVRLLERSGVEKERKYVEDKLRSAGFSETQMMEADKK
jgi:hypothetical protein